MDLEERPGADRPRHPWEEARLRFFEGVLRRSGILGGARAVLDVGAGDAWVARNLLSVLPPTVRVTCLDTGYSERVIAELGGGSDERIAMVRERPGGRFELILALDVMEHVEDDQGFLRSLAAQNLGDRGHLLVSVPAWPFLYSSHDARLHHHRRYTLRSLRALLADGGLEVITSGGLFHSLLVPRVLAKLGEALRGKPPVTRPLEWNAVPMATGIVAAALRLDNLVSRGAAAAGIPLPGLSWWALCQKR